MGSADERRREIVATPVAAKPRRKVVTDAQALDNYTAGELWDDGEYGALAGRAASAFGDAAGAVAAPVGRIVRGDLPLPSDDRIGAAISGAQAFLGSQAEQIRPPQPPSEQAGRVASRAARMLASVPGHAMDAVREQASAAPNRVTEIAEEEGLEPTLAHMLVRSSDDGYMGVRDRRLGRTLPSTAPPGGPAEAGTRELGQQGGFEVRPGETIHSVNGVTITEVTAGLLRQALADPDSVYVLADRDGRLRETNASQTRDNIRRYRKLLEQYGGNVEKALWAYHASPNSVRDGDGAMPDQTREYLARARDHLRRLRQHDAEAGRSRDPKYMTEAELERVGETMDPNSQGEADFQRMMRESYENDPSTPTTETAAEIEARRAEQMRQVFETIRREGSINLSPGMPELGEYAAHGGLAIGQAVSEIFRMPVQLLDKAVESVPAVARFGQGAGPADRPASGPQIHRGPLGQLRWMNEALEEFQYVMAEAKAGLRQPETLAEKALTMSLPLAETLGEFAAMSRFIPGPYRLIAAPLMFAGHSFVHSVGRGAGPGEVATETGIGAALGYGMRWGGKYMGDHFARQFDLGARAKELTKLEHLLSMAQRGEAGESAVAQGLARRILDRLRMDLTHTPETVQAMRAGERILAQIKGVRAGHSVTGGLGLGGVSYMHGDDWQDVVIAGGTGAILPLAFAFGNTAKRYTTIPPRFQLEANTLGTEMPGGVMVHGPKGPTPPISPRTSRVKMAREPARPAPVQTRALPAGRDALERPAGMESMIEEARASSEPTQRVIASWIQQQYPGTRVEEAETGTVYVTLPGSEAYIRLSDHGRPRTNKGRLVAPNLDVNVKTGAPSVLPKRLDRALRAVLEGRFEGDPSEWGALERRHVESMPLQGTDKPGYPVDSAPIVDGRRLLQAEDGSGMRHFHDPPAGSPEWMRQGNRVQLFHEDGTSEPGTLLGFDRNRLYAMKPSDSPQEGVTVKLDQVEQDGSPVLFHADIASIFPIDDVVTNYPPVVAEDPTHTAPVDNGSLFTTPEEIRGARTGHLIEQEDSHTLAEGQPMLREIIDELNRRRVRLNKLPEPKDPVVVINPASEHGYTEGIVDAVTGEVEPEIRLRGMDEGFPYRDVYWQNVQQADNMTPPPDAQNKPGADTPAPGEDKPLSDRDDYDVTLIQPDPELRPEVITSGEGQNLFFGAEREIVLNDGTVIRGRNVLMDQRRVVASHNAQLGHSKDYPAKANPHNYETGPARKHLLGLEPFNPKLAFHPAPTPDTGHTIINESYLAVSGNNRWILGARAYNELVADMGDVEGPLEWKIQVADMAEVNGFTTDQVLTFPGQPWIGFQAEPGAIPKNYNDFVAMMDKMNRHAGKDTRAAARATAQGRVADETMRVFGDAVAKLGQDVTIRAAVRGNTAIVDAMTRDGSIDPGNRATFVEEDGSLSPKGFDYLEDLLLGHLLGDPQLVQAITGTNMRDKLLRIAPSVDPSIEAHVRGAIEGEIERSRNNLTALGMLGQGDMFEKPNEASPVRQDRHVAALFMQLQESPLKVKAAFVTFRKLMDAHRGTRDMLEPPMPIEDAFRVAFIPKDAVELYESLPDVPLNSRPTEPDRAEPVANDGGVPELAFASKKYAFGDEVPKGDPIWLKADGSPPITGEPLSVMSFHGWGRADRGSIYMPGADPSPILGPGRYSTPDWTLAQNYGPNIEDLSVTLQNPYVLDSDAKLGELMGVGPRGARHMPLEEMIPAMRKVSDKLRAAGHDGVLVNITAASDMPYGDSSLGSVKALRDYFGSTQLLEFNETHGGLPSQDSPTPQVGFEPGEGMRYSNERAHYAERYVEGRELSEAEAHVLDVVEGLRTGNPGAIAEAAAKMASAVDAGDILVPIPDANGSVENNLALARAIAEFTGDTSVEIDPLIQGKPRESNRERHEGGYDPITVPELMKSMKVMEDPWRVNRGGVRRILLVDAMSTTGNTVLAARARIVEEAGDANPDAMSLLTEGLVYAKAKAPYQEPVAAGDGQFVTDLKLYDWEPVAETPLLREQTESYRRWGADKGSGDRLLVVNADGKATLKKKAYKTVAPAVKFAAKNNGLIYHGGQWWRPKQSDMAAGPAVPKPIVDPGQASVIEPAEGPRPTEIEMAQDGPLRPEGAPPEPQFGETPAKPITSLEQTRGMIEHPERVGNCWVYAQRKLMEIAEEHPDARYVAGTVEGREVARARHAWLTLGDTIYDPVYDRWFDAELYGSMVAPEPMHVFDSTQLAIFGLRSGEYATLDAIERHGGVPKTRAEEAAEAAQAAQPPALSEVLSELDVDAQPGDYQGWMPGPNYRNRTHGRTQMRRSHPQSLEDYAVREGLTEHKGGTRLPAHVVRRADIVDKYLKGMGITLDWGRLRIAGQRFRATTGGYFMPTRQPARGIGIEKPAPGEEVVVERRDKTGRVRFRKKIAYTGRMQVKDEGEINVFTHEAGHEVADTFDPIYDLYGSKAIRNDLTQYRRAQGKAVREAKTAGITDARELFEISEAVPIPDNLLGLTEMISLSYDVRIPAEGFAEFHRGWMTDLPLMMEIAPHAVANFEAALNQIPKKYAKLSRNMQSEVHQWMAQGTYGAALEATGNAGGGGVVGLWGRFLRRTVGSGGPDQMTGRADHAIAGWADDFRGFEAMLIDTGYDGIDPYKIMRLTRGAPDMSRLAFFEGPPDVRTEALLRIEKGGRWAFDIDPSNLEEIVFMKNPAGKGIPEILKDVATNAEDLKWFFMYTVAKRIRSIGEVDALKGNEPRNVPMDRAAVDDTIEAVEARPDAEKFRLAHEGLKRFHNQVLEFAHRLGYFSAEQVTRIRVDNPEYSVAFMRDLADAMGLSGKWAKQGTGSAFPAMRGSPRTLKATFETLKTNHARVMEAVIRNWALRRYIESTKYMPGAGKWYVELDKTDQKVVVATDKIIAGMNRWFKENGIQIPEWLTELKPEEMPGQIDVWFNKKNAPTGDKVFPVIYEGETKFFEVKDDVMWRAWNALQRPIPDDFTKALAALQRHRRSWITLGPRFIQKTGIKDIPFRLITTKIANPVLYIQTFVRSYYDTMGHTEEYKHFIRNMGGGGMLTGELEMTQGDLIRASRKLAGGQDRLKNLLPTGANLIGTTRDFVRMLQHFGTAIETAPRQGEGLGALRQGETSLMSAYRFRDYQDYMIQGDWGVRRWLGQTAPFMNATQVSMYKMYRSLSRDPEMKAATAGKLLGFVAFGMFLHQYNKKYDKYKEAGQHIHDGYISFMFGDPQDPDNVNWYLMPKLWDAGFLLNVGNRVLDGMLTAVASDTKSEEEAALERAIGETIFEKLLGGLGMVGGEYGSSLPVVAQEMFELARNERVHSGRAISPEYMKERAPGLRGGAGANPEWMEKGAEWTSRKEHGGHQGGVDAYVVNYLAKQVFAEFWDMANGMIDYITTPENEREEIDWTQTLARDFVMTDERTTGVAEDYYGWMDYMKMIRANLQASEKGSEQWIDERLSPEAASYSYGLSQARQAAVRNLQAEIRSLTMGETPLTPEERSRQLREKKGELRDMMREHTAEGKQQILDAQREAR